jgi:hypothetical protein
LHCRDPVGRSPAPIKTRHQSPADAVLPGAWAPRCSGAYNFALARGWETAAGEVPPSPAPGDIFHNVVQPPRLQPVFSKVESPNYDRCVCQRRFFRSNDLPYILVGAGLRVPSTVPLVRENDRDVTIVGVEYCRIGGMACLSRQEWNKASIFQVYTAWMGKGHDMLTSMMIHAALL